MSNTLPSGLDLIKKLRALRVGRSFYVSTDAERKRVLVAAQYAGIRIVTRVSRKGGFNCTRMLC
jgi:hypothetical protein